MPREPMRHVVVLLPGILGSALQRNGKDVWAVSGSAAVSALLSLGGNVNDLTLAADPPDVDDPGDGVVANRLLSDVHLIPFVWKIDGYTKVADYIKATFEVTPGRNYFEFPYDWRRDNRVAARRLAKQARGWLQSWRALSGAQDAKLILVAHSMGGLVSRYFLEVLDGWRDTKLLLTFGTPYRGSLNALRTLVEGARKGPFGIVDLSDFVRSLTAIYQLLPTYACWDDGNRKLQRVGEASGIPNVDAARAAAALAFHSEILAAVDAHEQGDEYERDRYRIVPVVGIEQATLQSARLAGGTVEFLETYKGRPMQGDGTVPRVSATPVELSDSGGEMFAATAHASLQNADPVLVQVHGALSTLDLALGTFRRTAEPAQPVKLSLTLQDAYWRDEPIVVRVRPSHPGAPPLTAAVETATGERVTSATLVPRADESRTTEFAPLAEGVYRVVVDGGPTVESIADVFTVFPRVRP
ncbi:MAG: hypothetical protein HYU41_12910 [Candidatus Rokubacteria bacterium]|nr:hypothetical protein [Candidatus Rokubacteria bacterium]